MSMRQDADGKTREYSTEKKPSEERAREVAAFSKIKTLDAYSFVSLSNDGQDVVSQSLQRHEFKDSFAVAAALRSVQEMHQVGLIHGDLKPPHIRVNQGKVVFIDFGDSVEQPLAKTSAHTPPYASFESLVEGTVHPADDYGAVLLSALFEIFIDLRPEVSESRKEVLAGKLKLMTQVAVQCKARDPFLRWICQKLMVVWSWPRESAVSGEIWSQKTRELADLLCAAETLDDAAIDFRLSDIQNKACARFDSAVTNCLTQDEAIAKLEERSKSTGERTGSLHSEMVHALSLSRRFREVLDADQVRYSVLTGSSQLDSVFRLVPELEKNPSLRLTPQLADPSFSLLEGLPGRYLYAETAEGVKLLLDLFGKFDHLNLSALETLMVFAGINVTSTQFFPQSPSVGLDLVLNLHSDDYAECLLGKVGKSASEGVKSRFQSKLEKNKRQDKNKPSVWLAAVLASGRLFLDSWDKTVSAGSYELWIQTSRKQREQLREELQQKDEELQQRDELIREKDREIERLQKQKEQKVLGFKLASKPIAKRKMLQKNVLE